tara:strand:+ start:682 stop:909 length:228 start_codon:yes stop_codon:yes gene_type:complete
MLILFDPFDFHVQVLRLVADVLVLSSAFIIALVNQKRISNVHLLKYFSPFIIVTTKTYPDGYVFLDLDFHDGSLC